MLIGGPSRPARRRSLRRAARLCGLLGDCTSDPPTGRCALDPDAIWPLKVRVRERLFEQGGAVYLIQAVRRPCACRAGARLRVWRRKRRPKPRDLFRVPSLAVIMGLLHRGPAEPFVPWFGLVRVVTLGQSVWARRAACSNTAELDPSPAPTPPNNSVSISESQPTYQGRDSCLRLGLTRRLFINLRRQSRPVVGAGSPAQNGPLLQQPGLAGGSCGASGALRVR